MRTTRAIQAFALLACAMICAAAALAALYIHRLDQPAAPLAQDQTVCEYEAAVVPAMGSVCDVYAPPGIEVTP